MTESATAETAYFHTLNARAYYFPSEKDKRLGAVSANLLKLPAEIRARIYDLAFNGSRVAVTSNSGCFCASDGSGPYREDHRWLLTNVAGQLRQEAQRAFIRRAMWELHCEGAFKLFIAKMSALGALLEVRHIRVNVFETSREYWRLPLEKLTNIRTVTFAPWQKGWTIDMPVREGSDHLSDSSIMEKIRSVMVCKDGYEPVRDLIASQRQYSIHFVFPIRYLQPGKVLPYRWKLEVNLPLTRAVTSTDTTKTWRANMDTNTIDRGWHEIYLVQEATLD